MNERINIFGTFVFAIASVLLLLLLLFFCWFGYSSGLCYMP